MSPEAGERWGVGRRARRRGQVLESLSATIPWLELQHLETQNSWGAVNPLQATQLSASHAPDMLTLVRHGLAEEAVAPDVAAWERQLRALPRRVRRTLERHFSLPLAKLALLLALWQAPAWAATINVDGTSCTLVNSIIAANTDTATGGCTAGSGDDTLIIAAGSTITLTTVNNSTDGPTGLPVVTSTITIAGQGSNVQRDGNGPSFRLLNVGAAGNLTIEDLTLQGGYLSNHRGGGIFNRGVLSLTNCVLTNNYAGRNGGALSNLGSLTIANSTLVANSADDEGGALFNSYGSVTITDSTIVGNSAYYGGALSINYGVVTIANSTIVSNSAEGSGGMVNRYGRVTITNSSIVGNSSTYYGTGGVSNERGGTLIIMSSTLAGNSADGDGGAVTNDYGTVTITNSTIVGNTADSEGGAIVTYGGLLTLSNSIVAGNTANFSGGGISISSYYGYATVTIANSTIVGNSATYGGGVSSESFYGNGTVIIANSTILGNLAMYGGGVFIDEDTLIITNSTLSSNLASDGGGLSNRDGAVTITNSTLTGNSAAQGGGVSNDSGSLTLVRTLVSGNSGSIGVEVNNGTGAVTADYFNLFGQNSNSGVAGFSPGASDIVPTVALASILEPLASNGGSTQTHNLPSGSPALNAVTAGGCPTTDQRSYVRPVGLCDIGAVEVGAMTAPEVTVQTSFAALSDTFNSSTSAAGCPAPANAGLFSFQALLTNQSAGTFLEGVKARVVTLTDVADPTSDILLQTADGGPGGVGALQTLPLLDDLSDGVLEPGGTVTVPFVICLESVAPFRFTVDLLGVEVQP